MKLNYLLASKNKETRYIYVLLFYNWDQQNLRLRYRFLI